MSCRVIFIVFMLLASDWHFGDAARILAVFPTASISHQIVFQKLTLELNKRGHELVVVTPNPVNDPTLKNYTEIDVSFQYNDKDSLPNIIGMRGKVDWFGWLKVQVPMITRQVTKIFEQPDLKKLYHPNSGEKFDLILMQMFFTPAFMSFAARFKAPMIGIHSASLQTTMQYAIGNPILHSDPSNWQLDMKFPESSWIPWRRLDNFIQSWRFIHYHRTVYLPKQQKIAEKYLGIDIPDLHDLEKNISLIFVNQQGPISFAKPNVPKVIDIGGFHVTNKIKPLPKDLKKVLDEATQGFVYMSLGSNVHSKMLPEKARKDILTAFSKLPYKVIWKFEDDTLTNLPENVIILKWTPQQAVIAHPNIKVFIYQGGLQSTEEAVSNGVPLIGLPVMSDQDMNVRKMESVGVAKKLEITNINEKDFFEAVRTVAGDDGYKQRMLNLRSLLKDKPYDMLENAVWWTEHVIRHRGAPYLHSTTADQPWYQRQDMDIVAFLSAMFVILSILSLFILYKYVIYSLRIDSDPTVEKSKKRN
ncbi:UDP-glycosyltransferase UGT5-like [Neodiprion pinetum]|uniref:UDP-glycosyltransferase UGT5-like n=1 Tax=Neodiprion pinetum TaxID=441929 RepID=UPI001EDFC542|nr:UDP-glycosyltransferase UGT5-like [Neodiprion pinetum]